MSSTAHVITYSDSNAYVSQPARIRCILYENKEIKKGENHHFVREVHKSNPLLWQSNSKNTLSYGNSAALGY